MAIWILIAGEQIGPFTPKRVCEFLAEGLVSPDDQARLEEIPYWQSVDHLLAGLPPEAEPEPPPVVAPDAIELAPEPQAQMELLATESPAPETQPAALTPTQKIRRRPGKIVIQQTVSLITSAKKSRVKKSAEPTPVPVEEASSSPPEAALVEPAPVEASVTDIIEPVPSEVAPAFEPGDSVSAEAPVAPAEAAPEIAIALPVHAPPKLALPVPLPEKPLVPLPPHGSSFLPREAVYGMVTLVLVVAIALGAVKFNQRNHAIRAPVVASPAKPVAAPVQTGPPAVPVTADDFAKRGFARQTQGDLDGAVTDYTQAVALNPKDAQSYYRRGLVRQFEGEAKGAMADFDQVLALTPDNADAFKNRGFLKQADGDLDGAVADYNEALHLTPKNPIVYYNLGLISEKKGDLSGAIYDYNRALDLDPKMPIAYYNRGVIKSTEGNLDGAIGDFTQAIVLNPTNALAYCNRGIARQAKGDFDGALADDNKAVELDPQLTDAYANEAVLKMQKGDADGAIDASTRAIGIDPKRAAGYYARGLARFTKGELEDAMRDLQAFCALAPEDSRADSVRLWIWSIAAQENPKGAANDELAAAVQNRWNSTPEDVASQIAAFLLDHRTEADLIAGPNSGGDATDAARACRIWYFAGMKRLLGNDTPAALDDFHRGVATARSEVGEFWLAQAQIQAIGPAGMPPVAPPPAAAQ